MLQLQGRKEGEGKEKKKEAGRRNRREEGKEEGGREGVGREGKGKRGKRQEGTRKAGKVRRGREGDTEDTLPAYTKSLHVKEKITQPKERAVRQEHPTFKHLQEELGQGPAQLKAELKCHLLL